MELTRKEFLKVVLLGGAVAACGGSASTPPNCAKNGSGADIALNHGHVLVVTKADIAAGAAKTYDITGTATHTHFVTLTAADMSMLQQNTQAMEVSTFSDGHDHNITVFCL